MDQLRILTKAAVRLDAERRLEYIVDTMSAVGGLFSDNAKKSSPLQTHLTEIQRLAGFVDGDRNT